MALLVGLGLNLNAQTTAQKGTYVKVDMKENGKETKIDTCFNGSMGDSIKKMFMNIHWDSLTKKFAEIGKQRSGKDSEITIKGGGGQNNGANSYTYSSGGKGEIVVTSGNGNGSSIILTEEDGDLKDPKGNTFKVHVLKNVEIRDLSSDDKKQLPQDVSSSINDARPFNNLNMYPNPTDGNIRITYKSASAEPLTIKAYDTYGKTVLTQTYNGLDNDVDKTISLDNLGKGIYFVQLIQGNQSEVRKVVVN